MEKPGNRAITRILDAALFSAHKHRDQRRKDANASPYINHPLALAWTLATTAGVDDADVLCAALLHDTVEDTETSFAELDERFGTKVSGIVGEVTDDKGLDKAERKRLQVEKASGKSREARMVKLADKICNLRDIMLEPPVEWPLERKVEYFNWAARVVAEMRGTNAALEAEFDRLFELGQRLFKEAPSRMQGA